MITPDPTNRPPTAQKAEGDGDVEDGNNAEWLQRAQDAYRSSTSYVDSNYRKTWDDSIRAFNSQHSSDSKYNQPAFEKRSRLFRPKVRSIIRKNEAAAAAAFFSNMDVVNIECIDQNDNKQRASAEAMKQLLQYRLTKSVPWYHVVLGGLQDAQNIGVVCAHVHWDYKPADPSTVEEEPEPLVQPEQDNEYPQQGPLPAGAVPFNPPAAPVGVPNGPPAPAMPPQGGQVPPAGAKQPMKAMGAPQAPQAPMPQAPPKPPAPPIPARKGPKPISDKPCVDLIPAENIRIDPGADWTDPVNSSPYIIHLMPMYVMDVKDKMESGAWKQQSDGAISNATSTKSDSTRASRQKDREDPLSSDGKGVQDYEICWVQRHIHRKDNKDWEFYTLGDQALLTDPQLLSKSVLHGKRPYVIGCCVLETHKIYPSSIGTLGKGLQDEANEVVNQRMDNVKFVLNKKYLVKRGKEADVQGLTRNAPGGVVMMDDPINDVRELSWPDVTQSAYEEQSRIDQDLNDLLGNFSPAQVMADHGIQGPARNMAMLNQSSGTLVEYLLRTYVETFIQPVLRQLVMLEQEYETDQVILSIAAKKAPLMQKFGMDTVTDEMLDQELTLNVNVGMGATDPQMKLQKFTTAMTSYVAMLEKRVPGIDMMEVGKEIFGSLGYSDGTRFFTTEDPQLMQLQQQLTQAMQMIQKLEMQVKEKQTGHQVKLEAAKMMKESKIITTGMHEDAMNQRTAVVHLRALRESDRKMVHDVNMKRLDQSHQAVQGHVDHARQMAAQEQSTMQQGMDNKGAPQ